MPDLAWRRWALLAVLTAVIVVLSLGAGDVLLAGRLLLAVRRVSSGSTEQQAPIQENRIRRHAGSQALEAIVYSPRSQRAATGIVLVPGVSELGCYHPRLVALSRALAGAGFLVLTPDIVMFREFRIAPEAMDEIAFWFHEAGHLGDGGSPGKIGLAGISFSGTLALITATRPEVRDHVAFVFAIGPYDDPLRCSRAWFAPGPVTVGPGYYPTRFYAKWIIMLAALDMIERDSERRFLASTLENLLLQRPLAAAPADLTLAGQRWLRLALMRENESDDELSSEIQDHLEPRFYERITPSSASEVRCPVFLVHGAYDDLIPPDESRALQRRILNVESHLLISPLLTHTHPMDRPMSWIAKARAAADIFTFFYRFARVVN
jgi:dienelactone hydrolase